MHKHLSTFFILTSVFCANLTNATELKVRAQFWTDDCSKTEEGKASECTIPLADGSVIEQTLSWNAPATEGEVGRAAMDLSSPASSKARLTLYHVYPRAESKQPRYFQVRAEFIAPTRGLCLQSVRERTPAEIPPLMCSVWNESLKKMQGVTIQFFAQ